MSPSSRTREEFQPNGIVTLTTDFGLRDPYVGAMKGVILRQNPRAQIVDLCHSVTPQSILEASFYLRGSWEYFPPGTIHVAVVDPGVGSKRSILLARVGAHLFLAPDNGLLTEFLQARTPVWKLDEAKFALPSVGRTFHGRDIFAPAAGKLSAGMSVEETGTRTDQIVCLPIPRAKINQGELLGEVLLADRFGNLVTSITEADIESLLRDERGAVEVTIGVTRISGIAGTYRDGLPGKPLALLGSYGHLEIAIPMGHAAERLGAGVGELVRIRPKGAS